MRSEEHRSALRMQVAARAIAAVAETGAGESAARCLLAGEPASAVSDAVARFIYAVWLAALPLRLSTLPRGKLLHPECATARLAVLSTAEHSDGPVLYNSQVSGQNRRYRAYVGQVEESQ